ncbi:MAG: glycoside hydrolase family 3 N-terminal domain-containing protein [Caldilineaceae bacterium]
MTTPITATASPLIPTTPITPTITVESALPTPTAQPLPTPAPTATLSPDEIAEQRLDEIVTATMARMSPADRVGQLFVINFEGDEVTQSSDIVNLINQYRIGGVVLKPSKHNFRNAKDEDTPRQVARLTNQLQAAAYHYLLPPAEALTHPLSATYPLSPTVAITSSALSPNIPLLVGIEQLGDGYPNTALRHNFTPLPSQLALGSTWNPALVDSVGEIVGTELSAVGINLLLGPNLDVVDQPSNDPIGALGLQSFGGNPYWVSQMARAYIQGVHSGSANHVAAIVRHFPGQGDIDRFPDQEVATVQKSLEELRRVALAPFTNVTRQLSPLLRHNGDPATTDGLMTSHMRFSALQGITSGRTTPISLMLDMQIILDQEGFGEWHTQGGIMMTNAIGVPAIRRYYDATLQEFPHKRVALDAFIAGHDLIYLGQLSLDNSWDTEKKDIIEIVQLFRERYEGDPDFRVRVDSAVQHILRLKLGLYQDQDGQLNPSSTTLPIPGLTDDRPALVPLASVLVRADSLAIFEPNSEHFKKAADIVGQVARESITVLYPNIQNLSDALPLTPQTDDHLLIFSDSRLFTECKQCVAETALGPEEIKDIITRLYGSKPGATGQITDENVQGRSFVELAALLKENETAATQGITSTIELSATETTDGTPTELPVVTPANGEVVDNAAAQPEENLTANQRLQQLIDQSNWLIFAMLDVDPEKSADSDVVKRFLRQQSEKLGNKQVIVIALNAPYFLDATEISKLTVYLGVYSKTQPFLESAVRALFRSYTPTGAPSVSVPGTRFNNLEERLQPNPATPLQLKIYLNDTMLNPAENANLPDPIVKVGDILRLEVDHVLDYNGRPAPDGVPVDFHLGYENRDLTLSVDSAMTRNGAASTLVTVEQPGRLVVSASAGAATTDQAFKIRVQEPESATVTNSGNSTATSTTATVTTTVEITPGTVVPANSPGAPNSPVLPGAQSAPWVNMSTLVIAVLTILVTLSLLLILQIRILPRAMLVHNMLWATVFGLGAYILYGLGLLPGADFLRETLRLWGAAVVVFISMLLPLLWLQLRAE